MCLQSHVFEEKGQQKQQQKFANHKEKARKVIGFKTKIKEMSHNDGLTNPPVKYLKKTRNANDFQLISFFSLFVQSSIGVQ